LAMNDGVTICINVLKSVLEHLVGKFKLNGLDDYELIELIIPFGEILGEYLGSMSLEERDHFRKLRGVQGQTAGTRQCQAAIQRVKPEFQPSGLKDFIERAKAGYNEQGRVIIDRIEKSLQDVILTTLKQEFDFATAPERWWFEGVPKVVRRKIDEKINETDGKAGGREQNFDLIHYREIIQSNWALFEKMLGYGSGSKEKKTNWISEVSIMRNTVMHPSRREYLSFDQLTKLQEYDEWLQKSISGDN
jgi:DNA sulfur modification protein DndB